jgi:hypothetical protein
MILARIYEGLSIPPHYAGKIEGRSSYARLGLMVHCTGDFINPGWRGHMPLQIVNLSGFTIKLSPLIPIVQLVLVKLTELPARQYGDPSLESKYLEDDGGPSYWWRDKLFTKVVQRIQHQDIRESAVTLLPRDLPLEVLERLDRFISSARLSAVGNGAELIEDFAESEDRQRKRIGLFKGSSALMVPVVTGASLGSLFVHPIGYGHWALWTLDFILAIAGVIAWRMPQNEFYGQRELERHSRMLTGGTPSAQSPS